MRLDRIWNFGFPFVSGFRFGVSKKWAYNAISGCGRCWLGVVSIWFRVWGTAIEQIWHIQDLEGQIVALALRSKSLRCLELFSETPLHAYISKSVNTDMSADSYLSNNSRQSGKGFHLQTLIIYQPDFNQNYYTFTQSRLLQLYNITNKDRFMRSKFPWNKFVHHKCFDMRLPGDSRCRCPPRGLSGLFSSQC